MLTDEKPVAEGRPKLFDEETSDVVVEMPKSLARMLTTIAKQREQTRSSLIRAICREYLQTQGEIIHVIPS